MIRTKQQDNIRNLLDLTKPWPAQQLPLLSSAAVHRAPRHPANCECNDCWNAGQRYADYLHQRRMEDL